MRIPGSTHWSLVTPPGVADNGGLVESASAGAVVVGVVPSGLLRFSPLAQSAHSGGSWAPAFLPGALAPLPDALAYDIGLHRVAPSPCSAGTGRCAHRPASRPGLLWSRPPRCSRVSPGCGVDGLDGAALLPTRGAVDRHGLPARRPGRPVHADRRNVAERRTHAGRRPPWSGYHRAPGAVDGSGDDRARARQPGGPA